MTWVGKYQTQSLITKCLAHVIVLLYKDEWKWFLSKKLTSYPRNTGNKSPFHHLTDKNIKAQSNKLAQGKMASCQ